MLRVRERAHHGLARVDVQRRGAVRPGSSTSRRHRPCTPGPSASSRRPRTPSPCARRAGAALRLNVSLRRQRRVARVRVEVEVRRRRPPVRSKSKSCASDAGSRDLHDRQRRVLGVGERADHRLARVDVQRRLARRRSVDESPPPPVHSRSVSVQPAIGTPSPCARPAGRVQRERSCEGSVALPASVSRSRSGRTPDPVRSKSKSCGSDAGSVTLTTFSEACLVFVNVQTTCLARVDVQRRLARRQVRRRVGARARARQRSASSRRPGLRHRVRAELRRVQVERLLRRQRRVARVGVEVQSRRHARP